MSKIKVTQKRSLIGQNWRNRRVIQALGLRGIGKSNELPDNNCTRGMINKVKHLVQYELSK